MRKEVIVVAALLLAVAVTAFLMLMVQHEELVNRETVNAVAPRLSR
jgi:hypothetical protein